MIATGVMVVSKVFALTVYLEATYNNQINNRYIFFREVRYNEEK